MSFISYAQNFEDVMLWRALRNIEKGFYIDIGAQHPVIDSVSMAFYERGWRGVHCEPNTYYAEQIRKARPDEVVYEKVIGASEGAIPFYEIRDTGLSTCDKVLAEEHAVNGWQYDEVTKKVTTLDNVFRMSEASPVHWLKIDVEGLEAEVLQGWRESGARPWIIVVESVYPQSHEDRSGQWENLLLAKDYSPVYFDGLNRFYLHCEHAELVSAFSSPPNVLDDFCFSEHSLSRFCRRFMQARDQLVVANETQLAALHLQLASIQTSGSWKITAPLRWLHARFAGFKS